MKRNRITPFLWHNDQADSAARFYCLRDARWRSGRSRASNPRLSHRVACAGLAATLQLQPPALFWETWLPPNRED
jgi:hypothetical protein